jgi:hypothetical protein
MSLVYNQTLGDRSDGTISNASPRLDSRIFFLVKQLLNPEAPIKISKLAVLRPIF